MLGPSTLYGNEGVQGAGVAPGSEAGRRRMSSLGEALSPGTWTASCPPAVPAQAECPDGRGGGRWLGRRTEG